MGTETAIPSGMLCKSIARAKAIPERVSSRVVKNTDMPSGKLCMDSAIAAMRAVFIALPPVALAFFSGQSAHFSMVWASMCSGTRASIAHAIAAPAKNEAYTASSALSGSSFEIICMEDGKMPIKETKIITPAEKLMASAIFAMSFLPTKNAAAAPIDVEIPAIKVTVNASVGSAWISIVVAGASFLFAESSQKRTKFWAIRLALCVIFMCAGQILTVCLPRASFLLGESQ